MQDTTRWQEEGDTRETAAIGPDERSRDASSGGAPSSERLARGTLVDRYVVIDLLGKGGMGVVYAAYDPELGRQVALKLLRLEPGATDASGGEVRLLREARALAQLRHPNVISVYDAGVVGQRVFVAMELVDGTTLEAWLRKEPRRTTEIVAKFVQAAQGLSAVHGAGLVHRDFKPKNVQLAKDGRVYLLDFGLARVSEADTGETPAPSSPSSPLLPGFSPGSQSSRGEGELDSDLTAAGKLVGTPAYLPPEAWEGARPDPRRDQWSFCLSLYEALAGEHPFPEWRSRGAPERWRLAEPAKFLALPRWLRRVLLRGLARDPEARHASMDALIQELNRGLERPRRSAVLVALVLAALGGAVGTRALARPDTQGCSSAGSDIENVWGPGTKARVRASFDRVGSAFAKDAFGRAASMVDGWAAGWRSMRQEACVATRVTGNQSEEMLSRRYACLDRRLVELRALTDVLTEVDVDRVAQAVKAAQGLTPVSVCTSQGFAGALRQRTGAAERPS